MSTAEVIKKGWDFPTVVKWGALLVIGFFLYEMFKGGNGVLFFLDIVLYVLGVGVLYILVNVILSFASDASRFGHVAAIEWSKGRLSDMANYGKGYLAFRIALVVMSICSGSTTWYGISSFLISGDASWFRGSFLPILIASGVSLTVYSLWNRLFVMVSSERITRWKKIRAVLLYPLIGGITIFIASTTTSVLGMGGKEAIKQHYVNSVESYQIALDEVVEYRKKEVQVIGLLERYKDKYSQAYLDEIEGNGRTETKGEGAVAHFLRDAQQEFTNGLNILESSNKKVQEENTLIARLLTSKLEDLRNTGGDIAEIEKEVENFLTVTRQQILEIRNQNSVAVLESLVIFLQYSERDFDTLSSNIGVKERQQKALEYYRNYIQLTSTDLSNVIQPLKEREVPQLPRPRRINPIHAIFVYFSDIASFWAFAIVVDFWVVVWLLMFLDFGSSNVMFDREEQESLWKRRKFGG